MLAGAQLSRQLCGEQVGLDLQVERGLVMDDDFLDERAVPGWLFDGGDMDAAFTLILSEAVLRCPVVDALLMVGQLRDLAELAALPNARLRVETNAATVYVPELTGETYSFSYADIVTDGLRAIRTGERFRFLIDLANPEHAVYVIRLDLPAVEDLYA